MSVASTDAKRRVKLYALNANRQWDDKGTGHVTSCYHEPLDGMSLLVKNESDGSLLLESKIQLDTQYQKQQGTLIVWTESDNYDLALSFQEQDGCNEIWEKICQVQGRDPSYEHDQDEEQEEVRINLVECDYDKLSEILEQILAFSQTTRRKDVLANDYIENDYISKLLHLFRQADEKQDLPTLYKLYEIFKQLFLFDRPSLTEVMLSDSFLIDIIGVFEYEPPQVFQLQPLEEEQEQDQQPKQLKQLEEQEKNNRAQEKESTGVSQVDVTVDQQHQPQLKNNNDCENKQSSNQTDAGATTAAVKSEENGQKTHQTKPEESDEIQRMSPDKNCNEQHLGDQLKKSEDDKLDDTSCKPSKKLIESETVQQNQQSPDSQQPQEANHEQSQLIKDEQHQSEPLPSALRKRHREFIKNGTTFKEVIPFSNQKLVDKIHQTYRVQYLQSSVLPSPSILEDNAYASLTSILFFNKVEIVSMIQEDGEFLQDLFNQIISKDTGVDRKRELVLFLKEYCIFSQTIQPKQRDSFFKTLASLKILSAVEVALSSNDQVTKSAAIDIFTYIVEYNPNMTREHAVQQREGLIEPPNNSAQNANILKLVIEHITTDQDPELGTATQLSCIIKLLLDPENMPGDSVGKHSFLEFFYFTCMQSLVEPIKNATTPDGNLQASANDRRTAQLLSIMLELLTFFMEHHYSQLRNYIISSDLLSRIISLIKSRHKFLVLSVIRFFRRLIATKDTVYYELIMNEDLFSPIISVFKNNNGRYNLLDSAILEMFEYIQNEGILPLMNHVLTNFGPFLESIDYVSTFKVMRQKNEALHENATSPSLKPNRSSIENSQHLYFGNHSRRDDMENLSWCMAAGTEPEVDDVGDVDSDKDIDPDSGDANVDSEPEALSLPELEFTMNGSKDEDEEIDEEEEVGEDDDIRMDDEDCEDELEPQFKRKKTK